MSALSRLQSQATTILRQPGLHRDALFLAAVTIVSGLGGFVYWKLITLRFNTEIVGLTSAGISSITFLSGLSSLGLTVGLVRFLPNRNPDQKSGLISAVTRISLGMGLVTTLLFLGGRHWWAPDLVPNQTGMGYIVVFIVMVLSIIQMNTNTSVLQAERRTPYLLSQSMIINIVQIAGGALVAVGFGATGVLFTYMLPILLVAVAFYFVLPQIGRYSGTVSTIDRPVFMDLLRYALSTQVFSIIWQIPTLVFPLLTLARLGAEANAGLALTWYLYTFLAIIPNAVMVALLVDGSHEPRELPHRLWDALLINLFVLLPLVFIIVIFAPWLLGYFGYAYIPATSLLRLLALSVLPVSINGLYVTRWRIRKQMLHLNIYTAVLVFSSIALSYFFMFIFELDGIGWGWLIGHTLFSLVTLVLIVRDHRLVQAEIL